MVPPVLYRKRLSVFERDQMVREHLEQATALDELASKYEVSPQYVQRSLIHAGAFRLLGEDEANLIRALWASGLTYRQIQAELGISGRRMQEAARALHLPVRPRGRKRQRYRATVEDAHGHKVKALTCRVCGETKPLIEFYFRVNPQGVSVPMQPCRSCRLHYPSQRKDSDA
jgi:transposase-like protein